MKERLNLYINYKNIRFTYANDKHPFHTLEIFKTTDYDIGQTISAVLDDCIELTGVFYQGGQAETKLIPFCQIHISIR